MTDVLTERETALAADQLVELLVDWGIEYVFICPGSTEAAFLAAAARQDRLKVLLTTHEGVTVSMADGLARETGRPAVAYLHANVGLTNGLSHLYAAQLARSPVVVLSGMKETVIQGRGGFTTAPYMRDFVRQYVKSAWVALGPDAVAEDVNRAIRTSATAPQGPTWVGIAQDLLEAQSSAPVPDASSYRVHGRTQPLEEDLSAAARLLSAGPRTVLVAGAELTGEGVGALAELAELTGAIVLAEDRRTGERPVFPTDHPAYAGMYAPTRATVQEADVIMFAGARCFTEFETPRSREVPADAALIHLHSDPAEVAKIYGVDVALVGDADAGATALLGYLRSAQAPSASANYRAQARSEHQTIRSTALAVPDTGTSIITVPGLMTELARLLDERAIVVSDATTSGGALLHAFESSGAQVHATSSGSLGWGMGAALGMQLAAPDRTVVGVLGDGVFQFGIPALWTAVRYSIPVVYIVVNNEAYAAVGAAIRRYKGEVSTAERDLVVDLQGPRIAEIAQGFGVSAYRITSLADLPAALERCIDAAGPTLIEVMTDPGDLGP